MKKVLGFLLAAMLLLVMAACSNQGSSEATDKVLMVPATRPSEPEETIPVYTRPSDEEEEEDGFINDSIGDGDGEEEMLPNEEGSNTDEDSGDSFTDGNIVSLPQVPAKDLSWDNINAFAIKSSNMSVAKMRALCVDFFRYAKTALWIPDTSIDYIRNAKGREDSMTGGQLYGGLPYVGSSSGNIYRLMDYINESNGVVNMADALKLTGGKLERDALKYFGNQCANGAQVGWARVINSTQKYPTATMTKHNGYLPLGPYTYDTVNIRTWSDKNGYRTSDIVKANGQQTMYQSYAMLQMGDGLVYYTTAGHVIMAATDAHVEYISGTTYIDGHKSYITIIDQAQTWETYTTADGRTYKAESSVDAKVYFYQLYNSNYLPFTFAEFLGTNGVEETACTFSYTNAAATLKDLCSATVTCNYSVTDAYIIVTNASGNEVYKHAVRNSTAWSKTLKMAQTGANVDSWGSLTAGTYNVKVFVQLGTGERPTIYTGTLSV